MTSQRILMPGGDVVEYVYHQNKWQDYSGPDYHIIDPENEFFDSPHSWPIEGCEKAEDHVVVIKFEDLQKLVANQCQHSEFYESTDQSRQE